MDGGAFGAAAAVGQQLFGSGVLEGSGTSTNKGTSTTTGNQDTKTKGLTSNKGVTFNKGLNNSQGTTNTTTVGTADKGALDQARSMVSGALSAVNDSGAINNLISSVLGKAAITFGQTQGGAERQAGLYDSSSEKLLSGFAQGQAAADATSAVLNYKTTEQGIANQANQSILTATEGSTVAGTTSNIDKTRDLGKNFNVTKNTQNQDTTGTQTTNTNSTTTQKSQSQQNGLLDNSVICSELMRQRKLDRRSWMISAIHFNNGGVSKNGMEAYHNWSAAVVSWIRVFPNGKVASLFTVLMKGRSQNIAWYYGRQFGKEKECPFRWKDLGARVVVDGITHISAILTVYPRQLKEKFSSDKWKAFDDFDRSIS